MPCPLKSSHSLSLIDYILRAIRHLLTIHQYEFKTSRMSSRLMFYT